MKKVFAKLANKWLLFVVLLCAVAFLYVQCFRGMEKKAADNPIIVSLIFWILGGGGFFWMLSVECNKAVQKIFDALELSSVPAGHLLQYLRGKFGPRDRVRSNLPLFYAVKVEGKVVFISTMLVIGKKLGEVLSNLDGRQRIAPKDLPFGMETIDPAEWIRRLGLQSTSQGNRLKPLLQKACGETVIMLKGGMKNDFTTPSEAMAWAASFDHSCLENTHEYTGSFGSKPPVEKVTFDPIANRLDVNDCDWLCNMLSDDKAIDDVVANVRSQTH